jgi:hypothetical protein
MQHDKNRTSKRANPSNMQQDIEQSTNLLSPSERLEVVMDGVVDDASLVNLPRTDVCSQRLVFLIPGLVIGCITFAPNLMLSDAGTKQAMTATTIGLLASGMFALAGVTGAILKTWKLYPLAVLLQMVALLTLS